MKKSVISFIAVMLVIVFLGVTAVTGLYVPGGWSMPFRDAAASDTAGDTAQTDGEKTEGETAEQPADLKAIIPSVMDTENGIRLGLDLVGGSRIVYEAQTPEGYNLADLPGDMQTAQAMIRQRLTSQGFTEATVALAGDNRISVEIPQITNPEEAVQTLGSTAQLLLMDMDGYTAYAEAYQADPTVDAAKFALLTGTDVDGASAEYGQTSETSMQQHYVQLKFTSEGRTKFADATAAVSARTDGYNQILIVMDGQIISAPNVSERIDSETCVITGSFDQASAQQLAGLQDSCPLTSSRSSCARSARSWVRTQCAPR